MAATTSKKLHPPKKPSPAKNLSLEPAMERADAFIASIMRSPRTAATYRFGLACLARFIADTEYVPLPSPHSPARFRDDVLLRFQDWQLKQRYSPASHDNYLAAVKRFLIWLDANDHLPPGFQVGKAVNRLKAAVGYAGPMFIQSGAISYSGVDINEKLVGYANDNYASELIRYSVGDICTFQIDKHCDLISCFETIEHVQDYSAAIKNLHSLLKPGGLLLISSPNRPVTSPNCNTLNDKPSNEFHVQEFIPDELLTLLNESGFSSDKNNVYGQRQRKKVYRNRYIRKIIYTLLGNPDINTSPRVTTVKDLLPRYLARRCRCS